MSLIEELSTHFDDDSEALDPRIQQELERLNQASSDINKMENELEDAKNLFNTTRNRQLQRLEFLQKKFGSCIVKSKPYYEALKITEKLRSETQKAVQEYQKAYSLYKTAKETLSVAENNLSGEIPDVWQEHMSTTITKINMSKKMVDQAEENHRQKTAEFQSSEERCLIFEKDLKKYIIKSQPYYEEKNRWNVQTEAQKARIDELERALTDAKVTYKEAMKNLSNISEQIHEKRSAEKRGLKKSPSRESGVGSENPNDYVESLN
ncbi:SH3 domain-binding 5 isoform X3 [Brachionus plicatilis]|uniref:SH3 domain-binding 5 isoform X3 n=1 Tax=Brachionus plicatilis TaxID=10195 RepID=A0A3M7PAC8_BRAPC|nr:SH3 domain-binding 5 isoform X3 [Brachionus plicatilis]